MKNTASLKSPAQRLALAQRNSVVLPLPFAPSPDGPCSSATVRWGGSVHTPDDSLYLLVARCDTWTGQHSMGSIAAVRIRGGAGLFQQATSVRQECDLARACIRIDLETAGGPVKFKLTATRGKGSPPHRGRRRPDPAGALRGFSWKTGMKGTPPSCATGIFSPRPISTAKAGFDELNRRSNLEPADLPGIVDPLLKPRLGAADQGSRRTGGGTRGSWCYRPLPGIGS